jgi:hypothetical protein
MKAVLFASVALATLRAIAWREPSCCPYCPDVSDPHWIRWGFYPRWGETRKKRLQIQRYQCKITGGTFSLLPDSLLPYHYFTTAHILQWLHALIVEGVALSALALRKSVARSTLRHLKASFLDVVGKLRLPERPAALSPPAFLRALADMTTDALADLFAGWKEMDPKHSVVGFFPR